MTQPGKKIIYHHNIDQNCKAQLSDCEIYRNQLHATYLFHHQGESQQFEHQCQQRINSNCCYIKKIRSFQVVSKNISCEKIYLIRLIYDFWGPEQTLAARYLQCLKSSHKHFNFSEKQAENILDSIVLALKKFQQFGYRFAHLNMNNIINENQTWILTEIQPYHNPVKTQLLASPEQILYENGQIYHYCHLKSSLYRIAMIIISLLKGNKWRNLTLRPEYYQICEQIHSISKQSLRQKIMILSSLTPDKRMRIFGIIREVNTVPLENKKNDAADLDIQNISTIVKNSKVRRYRNHHKQIRIKTGNMGHKEYVGHKEHKGHMGNIGHSKGCYKRREKMQDKNLSQNRNIKFTYRSNSHSTRIQSLSNHNNIQNVKVRSYQSSPKKQQIDSSRCESAISTNRFQNEEQSSKNSKSSQKKGQSTYRDSEDQSKGQQTQANLKQRSEQIEKQTKIKWKSNQQYILSENHNAYPISYPTNKTFIDNLYTNKTIKSTGLLHKVQQKNSSGCINSIKVLEDGEDMNYACDQQCKGDDKYLLSEVMVGYRPKKYNPYASNNQDRSDEHLITQHHKGQQYSLNISKTEKFMDLNNGFMYLGQCFENVPHGHGCLYYQTSQKAYEGQWLHGIPHGTGMQYPNINFQIDQKLQQWEIPTKQSSLWCEFEGSFENGVRNGKGMVKLNNGDIFKGIWKDGKATGGGRYLKVTGQTIKGKWTNNKLIKTS